MEQNQLSIKLTLSDAQQAQDPMAVADALHTFANQLAKAPVIADQMEYEQDYGRKKIQIIRPYER